MSADGKTSSKDSGKTKSKSNVRVAPDWTNTPLRPSYRNRVGGCFQNDIKMDELEYLMLRDPAGKKIVRGPAIDAFKRPPSILCPEKPDFQLKANELLNKLDYHNELKEAYISGRGFGFGLVLFGLMTVEGLEQPVQNVRDINNVASIWRTQVDDYEVCEDPMDLEYFGKIKSYTVFFKINGQRVKRKIHASRVQHVVDEVHNNDPGGVPVLYPLFDTFQGKKNMDLSLYHAIYRYSSPFTSLELPADADLDEFTGISEMFYLDDRNEFVMPSGYKFTQYGASGALNPEPYIDYMWQNLCSGSEYNKTKLVGAEAGAVTGSWVNQADYYNEIADIQTTKLQKYYVDAIKRFQAWGLLKDGDFEFTVDFPQLWELDQKDMADMQLALSRAEYTKALTLEKYIAMTQADKAPFTLGFDDQGWYLQPKETDTDDIVKQYLFKQNEMTVKAKVSSHISSKVNKYRSKADKEKLWKIWGYNTKVLEMEHKSIQSMNYTKIAKDLQKQVKAIIEKHLPGLGKKKREPKEMEEYALAAELEGKSPYQSNEALPLINKLHSNKEVLLRVVSKANDLSEAIEEIRKKLKIPASMSNEKAFETMMKESHKYGWEVTLGAMKDQYGISQSEWLLGDVQSGIFLQRSKLLWEEKHNDCLTAAKHGVIEGILAGESITQITDRIAESITKVARPDVFVHTEVHRATELGRTALYKKEGITLGELLTAGDEMVRTRHSDKEMEGPVPLEELEEIVAEFNCRCTILPVHDKGGAK